MHISARKLNKCEYINDIINRNAENAFCVTGYLES